MRRHALFVLGMHRSGTSALTGAIAKAGANPGMTLMPATADNPEGYWEDARLVGFNDELLRKLGSRWDSIAPLPQGWTKLAAATAAHAEAVKLIEAEWPDAKLAVVKDPRLCRLLPVWRAAFAEAGFAVSCVLITRNPTDVAGSLARRDQFAPEKSLALWLAHLTDAERESRELARVFVTYERLLAEPALALERVCAHAAFPLTPSAAQLQAALAVVRPDLNREGSRPREASRATTSPSLASVLDAGYATLAALAPDADPRSAVETLAREAASALAAALPPWIAHELAAAQALARTFAEDLDSARTSVAALEEQIGTAKRAHATRDGIESELRTKLARAPVTADDLAAFGRELRDELAPLAGALATASQAAASAADAQRSVREELDRARRELGDERATIAALNGQIDVARIAAHDLEGQIERARHHIDQLARELVEARRAHAARDEIEAALAGERDALREEVAALRVEAAKVAPLAEESERLGRESSALAQQARALATDRDRLAALEGEARERIAGLESELDAATGELDRLSSRWLGRLARRLARQ